MSINHQSFNFKLNPADHKKKKDIANSLKPKQDKISQSLEYEGFKISQPKIKKTLCYDEKIFESFCDYQYKFTNYVDLKKIDEHIKENLEYFFNDTSSLLESKVNQVEFDTSHTKRLSNIMRYYNVKDVEDYIAGKKLLFKVHGKKTISENHNKESISENRFRVYLGINNIPNEITQYNIFFLDIYHLAIPSFHCGMHRGEVQDRVFLQNKYFKGHLKDLIEQLNIGQTK